MTNAATTTITITHGGETRVATPETWKTVCDELVAKHGPGVPRIETAEAVATAPTALPKPARVPSTPKLALVPPPSPVPEGAHDVIGEARSAIDAQGAREGGFAPAQPLYRRGTRVAALGVTNAYKARREHDALPSVASACGDLETIIAGEKRSDYTFRVTDLQMDKRGHLVMPLSNRKVSAPLTEHAFGALATRVTEGGGGYLRHCWPELRAINVNHWIAKHASEERETANADPMSVKIRTRKNGEKREIFALVTPTYTAFDVDRIARAVALAMPETAKCELTYTGERAIFDVRFHSTVQPEHFVAGEFFRAGIRITTDDTGGGAIKVSSTVFQNLCLNLIVIDQQTKGIATIRHVGSEEQLASRFRDALRKSKESLAHFLKAWGYAASTKIEAADLVADPGTAIPTRFEAMLPGIFNGLVERELVPLRAKKEAIPQLMRMWEKDTSAARGATRGAIVNAITRYAHEVNEDPIYEDELERAAGALVYRTALPYVPVG